MKIELEPIGYVRSPYKTLADCPKMGMAEEPAVRIEILPQYAEAMIGLEPGQEADILAWFHMSDRTILMGHPQGRKELPKKGVFALRAPVRPNPIGLTKVRILAIEAPSTLVVQGLESLDGTPIVDVKRHFSRTPAPAWGPMISSEVGEHFREIGKAAWTRGLLSGFNGNFSRVEDGVMVVTRSGSAKGHLRPGDLAALEMPAGRPISDVKVSTETPMHLAVYACQPQAKAIMHCHPPRLLALTAKSADLDPLDLPLFEAGMFTKLFTTVPAAQPGTERLAALVGEASRTHRAVFMERHGLVCWGNDLYGALALCEEIESLANIRLLSL